MTVSVEPAGEIEGEPVVRAVLRGAGGLEAVVTSFGATLQALRVPDSDGRPVDLVLGFERPGDYLGRPGAVGATVGRFANRIAHGRFTLDGRTFQLPCNQDGRHHLHGGPRGFGQRVWTLAAEPGADAVVLRLVSEDGDQGYPGRLEATCRYALEDPDTLVVEMTATSDAPTPVNLVNHTYWNLAGFGTIDGHRLQLFASRVLEVDAELIPTGRILEVAGTPLDFRRPRALGEPVPVRLDHCFLVDGEGLRPVARLQESRSGRLLELFADQPGVQVYTAEHLDVPGRSGGRFGPRSGLCLETEALPDAPNHPNFPSAILRPGELYRHRMVCRLRRG